MPILEIHLFGTGIMHLDPAGKVAVFVLRALGIDGEELANGEIGLYGEDKSQTKKQEKASGGRIIKNQN